MPNTSKVLKAIAAEAVKEARGVNWRLVVWMAALVVLSFLLGFCSGKV